MLQLTIPQLGEESRNVKDLVFTILTQEQPLSLIELTNRIRKQHIVAVTYQAVRKAVSNLEEQGVLQKQGKRYSLNKQWIFQLKSYFDKLALTQETKRQGKTFTTQLAKEDYALYTLTTLLDLDNFWGEIMSHWAETVKDNKNYFSYCHYHWWMLINLGQETKLFQHYNQKKIKSTFFISIDLPLNRWAAQVYKAMGVTTIVQNVKLEEPLVDVNILGDMIIQVKYPPELLRKMKKLFEKYSTAQEIPLQEITKLAHEQYELKLILFKNPVLARHLLEGYKARIVH